MQPGSSPEAFREHGRAVDDLITAGAKAAVDAKYRIVIDDMDDGGAAVCAELRAAAGKIEIPHRRWAVLSRISPPQRSMMVRAMDNPSPSLLLGGVEWLEDFTQLVGQDAT